MVWEDGEGNLTSYPITPSMTYTMEVKVLPKADHAIEAKRNCGRATDCGKEAWSETAGRRTETGSEALPIRASGQRTAKLSWSRIRRRKSGGRAAKGRRLIWGDLALWPKGRRDERSEKSAEAVLVPLMAG